MCSIVFLSPTRKWSSKRFYFLWIDYFWFISEKDQLNRDEIEIKQTKNQKEKDLFQRFLQNQFFFVSA